MVRKLLKYVEEQKLFQPEDKILLAISGGIDSMVMLDLFNRAKLKFAVAHCNFNLRGKDSDDDQKMVEEKAIDLIVPFHMTSFDTRKHAKSKGISIQMAARDLRKTWLESLMKVEGYKYIATAHHLNDSLETAIFNLSKGTGISGLKGIIPKSGKDIRPLMFATRKMIDVYASENALVWREDKSNASTKYSRNLIRHKVIPELKKINPSLEETFSHSMEKIAYAEQIFKEGIKQLRDKLLEKSNDGFMMSIEKISALPDSGIILKEVLEEFGFNYRQTRDLLCSIHNQPGKTFFSEKYKIITDRKFIFLSHRQDEFIDEISISKDTSSVCRPSLNISFEFIDFPVREFKGIEKIAYIDYDKLQFPLKIRKWKHGDRFQPLGMQHKKKLSDFMIDNKIPLNLKEQVFVLLSADKIAWVVGMRIDDRFKVTRQTKSIFKISLEND